MLVYYPQVMHKPDDYSYKVYASYEQSGEIVVLSCGYSIYVDKSVKKPVD